MLRSGSLEIPNDGNGGRPSMQGLAIINESESFRRPEAVPGIAIDDSFLSPTNYKAPSATWKGTTNPEGKQLRGPVRIPTESLCGSRIAVYRHTPTGRAPKKNVATIGGVFRIGERRFALTVAHVFFDNDTRTGSWANGGLKTANTNSNGGVEDIAQPKISEIYEVVVECYWQNTACPDIHALPTNLSLGLVAPSVLHRRKSPDTYTLPEVIWSEELDWALIELTHTAHWQSNKVKISPAITLGLEPPLFDQQPPGKDLIVVSGASGAVRGRGLNETLQLLLPWPSPDITTWTIEAQLTAADCGAVAIAPNTGIIYGMVVAHDSENGQAFIVPSPILFESILERYSEEILTLGDMFSTSTPSGSSATLTEKDSTEDFQRTPVVRSIETNVMKVFQATLKSFSMRNVDGFRFIRKSSWLEWLKTIRRDGIPNIDFLLDDAYPRNSMLPITSDQLTIGTECASLVFTMLYECGRGELIHLFMRQGLTDNRLPFDMALLNDAATRMSLPHSDDIMQTIYKNQWSYCPMIFDLGMERDVPAQVVIPVQHRRQINSKGGTATLWQITVLEEFISKRLQEAVPKARFNDLTDKLGYRYHLAIKSSSKAHESHFVSEVAAFKAFHHVPSMIGYLGNYSHTLVHPKRRAPSFSVSDVERQTKDQEVWNNILLEYGDFDLDEYFAATQPPVLPVQVTQVWQEIAGIAEAISEIHNFSTRRAGVKQEYAGWHADIKPDNILNVKGGFKLADPGFARFERSQNRLNRLTGGTRTFDSPEVHSARLMQDKPVSQAIDIWSLGCVLSVVSTWIILGWPGVTQFQQLRLEALKQLGSRLPGRQRSRSRSNGHTSSLSIEDGGIFRIPEGDCFHDGKNVLREIRQWHSFLRSVVRKSDTVSVQMIDLVDHQMLTEDPEKRIQAADLYSQMRVIVHSSESSKSDVIPDVVNRILLQTVEGKISKGPKLSMATLSSTHTDIAATSANLHSSSRSLFPSSPKGALSSRRTATSSSTGSDESEREAPQILPEPKPQRPMHNILLNETGARSVQSSIDVPTNKVPRPVSTRKSTLGSTRRMSVSEARAEIEKKKKTFLRRKKDPYLLKHLENRDIEFLIDNGDTMAAHWTSARDLVEVLSAMVADIDKDGYDLSFTNGPIKLKQKSSSKAIKSTMDTEGAKPQPNIRTNMADALERVLSQFYLRIKSSKKHPRRNYTLIVLTDGLWRGMPNPQAAEDTIVRWLNKIVAWEGPRRQTRSATIQFIQFGMDDEAVSRLEALDRGLVDYEIPDIIDMEPADGNVWKMLLGSVDPDFDYADSGPGR